MDFFITNGISQSYTDVVPSFDLSSDHSPIIATISTTVIIKKPTPRLHNFKTNWDTYRLIIEQEVNLLVRLQTPEQIETETNNLINLLQNAAKQSTPQPGQKKFSTNIPLEIKRLVAEKRKARSIWQRTHRPDDRTIYNNKTRNLKTALEQMRNNSFENYVSNLSRQDNSIWKPIKNKNKPINTSPPIRKNSLPPGPWAKSNKEKADLFAEHLTEVFKPHDNDQVQEVEQELALPINQRERLTLITPKEIKDEINHLNEKKAPGTDLITATMLKQLPKKGIMKLLYILNAILRLNYWPISLKIAQVIMIPKPGKALTDVSSYRPISLLPIMSKLLEKLLLKRIMSDLEFQNWIPEHQFGFRQGHSTVQQCHRISNVINRALDNKQYCTAAFLDISQAFDKVWHPGLLYKIKKSLPNKYFDLLKSYLNHREFETKVEDELSNRNKIQSGVPQGSILGPLLYVLYTSDLPTSPQTTIGTFADDTAIFATEEDPRAAVLKLQEHLDQIGQWLKKWKIKANETKSTHITFTLRKDQCPNISLNQVNIPQQNIVKYLGLHLDSKLNWKQHILKKKKQIELRVKEINWLIGRKSRLSIENKLLIYKTVIKPIWTYGIELWSCASKSNTKIIQRTQSKILRTIANAPWYISNQTLHTDLNIPLVSTVIQERANRHHEKLEDHPNQLILPLLQPLNNRRLRRLWPIDLR